MELAGDISPSQLYNSDGNFSLDHQESYKYDEDQLMAHNNFLENFMASSLDFPFSTCTFEGDEIYSYGENSVGHQPVSFTASNSSSLALRDDENDFLDMKYSNLYLNIDSDHDNDHRDHAHGQCVSHQMVNNVEPNVGIESHLKRSSTYYNQGDKSKRSVKPRKNKKIGSIIEESPISPTNFMSKEEESNAFTKESSLATNLSGKTRAFRGCATDPQSVYARKRRDKINERLRILQKLVPNGTKVDISTMLEEAVQYVKFLQLQIKVLSSNDLWMYAPIAYNGMSIGFELNDPFKTQQLDPKP